MRLQALLGYDLATLPLPLATALLTDSAVVGASDEYTWRHARFKTPLINRSDSSDESSHSADNDAAPSSTQPDVLDVLFTPFDVKRLEVSTTSLVCAQH